MRGQAGIFAWENAAGVRHELAEQIDVLIVKGIHGKIDFWLRPWSADFHRAALGSTVFAATWLVGIGFAGHKILADFAVQCMPAEEAIVFHQFDFFSLKLLVPGGEIAGR
jgi:hypothetical protein